MGCEHRRLHQPLLTAAAVTGGRPSLLTGFSPLRSLRSLQGITKPASGWQRVGLHSPMAYLTLGSPQSGSPSLLAPRILQHPRWSKLFRPPRPPPKCKHCRSGRNDFSTKQMDPVINTLDKRKIIRKYTSYIRLYISLLSSFFGNEILPKLCVQSVDNSP